MPEPISILMVEDDPTFSRYLQTIVRHSDLSAEVTEVGKIEDAAQLLRSHRYSCVLLDLTLPNGRGMAAIDRLLQFPAPLVIVTGDDDPETRKKALRHGAQEFITKMELSSNGSRIITRLIENATDRFHGVGQLIGARGRALGKAIAEGANE